MAGASNRSNAVRYESKNVFTLDVWQSREVVKLSEPDVKVAIHVPIALSPGVHCDWSFAIIPLIA